VRFGFYTVVMPALLKPAPARLLAMLSLIEANHNSDTPRDIAATLETLPAAGLTSTARAPLPFWLYRASGYYTTKSRAIRLDMLERLADLIRPALEESKAAHGHGFQASEAMMSIMGCGADELTEILSALGYQSHEVEAPAPMAAEEKTEEAVEAPSEAVAAETPSEEAPAKEEPAEEVPAEEVPAEEAPAAETPAEAEAAPIATGPVTYWRPARIGNRPNAKKGAPKGGRKANPNNKAKSAPRKNTSKPARAEKKPDPNSPFAVLQNLKNDGKK
jgi:ATP-dependent RNA helicase SUPV3L1/SUV3